MKRSTAEPRTWTIEGRVGFRMPAVYGNGRNGLGPGERVEVVELSHCRALEVEVQRLRELYKQAKKRAHKRQALRDDRAVARHPRRLHQPPLPLRGVISTVHERFRPRPG